MQQALSAGKRARGVSNPNPAVGAVVVVDDVVVSEGWTGPPGEPHAEVHAINRAGDISKGATMYVTLEPCCHTGRTGPCTSAIIDSGISKVYVAAEDPDSRVSGGGISVLRENGIEVVVGELQDEASIDLESHLKLSATGFPFVTVKFAVSLDGKIATRSGDSQWITNAESRERVHVMRAENDAVMVGINTVVVDDPRLTARGNSLPKLGRQPTRIIVDSDFRTPVNSSMFQEEGQTIVVGASENQDSSFKGDVKTYSFPGPEGKVDLESLLKQMGREPISSILVEGGGELIGSLFDSGLVDKVVAFIAPVVIGGVDSPSAVKGKGALDMSKIYRLKNVKMEYLETDVMISGYWDRG